jgi:single-strand DNA-binding protein
MNGIKNKVQLIGILGELPNISKEEDKRNMATLKVCTNEIFRNAKNEKVTETQWHIVVAWGKLAEIAEKYLVKGAEVAIEGKLINRSYTDSKGILRYVTEIHASELLILTKR